MNNPKEELQNLIPSLKDKYFQQQLDFEGDEEKEGEKPSNIKRNIVYGVCLIASLGIFSYLAYTSYKYSSKPQTIEGIPLAKKDLTPVRIVPDDPGGEKFSNQDKLIYNNLMGNKGKTSNDIDSPASRKKMPAKLAEPTPKPKPVAIAETKKKETKAKPASEKPRKLHIPKKVKVAKPKKKEITNPFDMLDDGIQASDSTKVKN